MKRKAGSLLPAFWLSLSFTSSRDVCSVNPANLGYCSLIAIDLTAKKCVPCRGGVPPLKGPAIQELFAALGNGWIVIHEHHLEKEYKFCAFADALVFTNHVGALAEAEGHHPDIYLAWGKVKLTLWTHKIDGLTESDFIFAAKADPLYSLPEESRSTENSQRSEVRSQKLAQVPPCYGVGVLLQNCHTGPFDRDHL